MQKICIILFFLILSLEVFFVGFLNKGKLYMYQDKSTETNDALVKIQRFCTKYIAASEVGNILTCIMAAKGGFLNDALINRVKEDELRIALRALRTQQEEDGGSLSMTDKEQDWLSAYLDFVHRTRF